jgi:hypothetical protein
MGLPVEYSIHVTATGVYGTADGADRDSYRGAERDRFGECSFAHFDKVPRRSMWLIAYRVGVLLDLVCAALVDVNNPKALKCSIPPVTEACR